LLILILIGTPVALWLSRTKTRLKPLIQALVATPVILPPSVLGFYLLIFFRPQGLLGRLWEALFGTPLVFTFSGLVLGSVVFSLPFFVQPLQSSFSTVSERFLETAETLGAGKWDQFFSILLPLSKEGFLVSCVLTFAHTVGEFGVVLMIGGSIPGETKVLSIEIYEAVEALEYSKAHEWSLGLLLFSVCILSIIYFFKAQKRLGISR